MAAYNKYQDFVEQLGLAKHDLSAAGHVLKVYLSNTAPTATDTSKPGTATEISAGAGYTAGGTDIQNGWSESAGTATMTGVDVVWTASGGTIGPFRYVVLYNDTATSPADALIGWWDYGSSITLNDTETFTVDFSTSVLTLA